MSKFDIIFGVPVVALGVACAASDAPFIKRLARGLLGVLALFGLLGLYAVAVTPRAQWQREWYILFILWFGGSGAFLAVFFAGVALRALAAKLRR